MQGYRRDEASRRFTGVRHLTHRTQTLPGHDDAGADGLGDGQPCANAVSSLARQAGATGRGAGPWRAGRRAGAHGTAAFGRGLKADGDRGESGRRGRQPGGRRGRAQRLRQPYLLAQSIDHRIGQPADVRQHAVRSAAGPAAGRLVGQQPVVPVRPVLAGCRYA
ncbi:hypothetical protein G6F57_019713 [Rhizopus arrhizus]|nr:hypothetical protein G6F57_019713 [Rhizopus arrhizus]